MKLIKLNALLLLAALNSGGCAALPPDLQALQDENTLLRQLLEEAEEDLSLCADIVEDCQSQD